MTAYTYEAINDLGQSRRGVIEADSPKSARALLRSQGLIALEVKSAHAQNQGLQTVVWERKVFGLNALALWTRQLASLVGAGLPLERALVVLADESETMRQRDLIANLRAEVSAGSTFSQALSAYPREFSISYVAVASAGEQGGKLDTVLQQLADELLAQQNLQQKLMAATLYPAIVSVVAVAIVIFLLTWVVPIMAQVFSSQKQALPWLTRLILMISQGVRDFGGMIGLLAFCGALVIGGMLRRPSFRIAWDAAYLNLPGVGRLARDYNAAKFAGALGMLTAAGVPILKSLQTASDTLSNQAMRADAQQALVLVREGAPLASALSQYPRFGRLVTVFARLGEQTGALPAMLGRASNQLSEEVQRRALKWVAVLEPLLIVTMGAFVMLIVLAVTLPIFDMYQWVK